MHSLNPGGWLRRSATLAILLGALPLTLVAQIRRPDPVPAGRKSAAALPKRRIEIYAGGGILNLNEANATRKTMPIVTLGIRHQLPTDWLFVGGSVDVGRTTVDGRFFPYERRPIGDSLQFVQVDGHATMVAARLNAEVLVPLDEDEKFRAGVGFNGGAYAMFPSPSGGAGAGTFIAPTFGAAFLAQADLTRSVGVTASLGFTEFLNFDRDKLRPSDPAKADPVFTTPLQTPPKAVKSFGGVRIMVGLTYRIRVNPLRKRGAK